MNGPGYVDTLLPVEESKRSQSSQDSKDKNGAWEATNIGTFAPERWLAKGESGELEFNARAGPAHPFGAGTYTDPYNTTQDFQERSQNPLQ